MAEAKQLKAEDYTEATWTALQTALNAAESVMANVAATQEEVAAAFATLIEERRF
ncbi:hypothetical protein [Peribacillus butanolivorans]|uniref:hypothetical protein n=1 Tax=Peribacillus butanolivorans TaxID=421767 RepID=UPI0034D98240